MLHTPEHFPFDCVRQPVVYLASKCFLEKLLLPLLWNLEMVRSWGFRQCKPPMPLANLVCIWDVRLYTSENWQGTHEGSVVEVMSSGWS